MCLYWTKTRIYVRINVCNFNTCVLWEGNIIHSFFLSRKKNTIHYFCLYVTNYELLIRWFTHIVRTNIVKAIKKETIDIKLVTKVSISFLVSLWKNPRMSAWVNIGVFCTIIFIFCYKKKKLRLLFMCTRVDQILAPPLFITSVAVGA